MAATGLNHVSISASDLEESVRFYEQLFGLERIATPNFGFPVQWLRCGALQLHIFERPDEPPQYHHVALTVDDFEAVYAQARELGIFDRESFGAEMYELPDGAVQLYLRDPGGNLIEVDWPDVTALDRSRLPEIRKLSDKLPQRGDSARATLFLERQRVAAGGAD